MQPSAVNQNCHKIYDLVVRRFFAVFGDPAVRETMNLKIDCNKEIFIAKGTTTIEGTTRKTTETVEGTTTTETTKTATIERTTRKS